MSSYTCVFPVEVKDRDFDSRLYLAVYLASKGYNSIIGSKTAVNDAYSDFPKTIIFDKGLVDDRGKYLTIRSNGGRICALDEEGGIFSRETLPLYYHNHHPTTVLDLIDTFFLWGNEQKQYVQEHFPEIESSRITVSGNARFDLLKPSLMDFYDEEVKSLQEKYGNYILFNTNFGVANNTLGFEYGIILATYIFPFVVLDDAEIVREYQDKLMENFIAAVIRLANEAPQHNVIVRPHPGESKDIYEKAFATYPNIHISNKGNVHMWILASKAIVHHDCTTGIESALTGRPTISYAPISIGHHVQQLPMAVSTLARSEDELLKLLHAALSDSGQTDKNRDTLNKIKPWINNTDSFCCEDIHKAVDRIATHQESEAIRPQKKAKPSPATSLIRIFLNKTKSLFANESSTPTHRWEALKNRKMPGISLEETTAKAHRLAQLLNIEKNITISKHMQDCMYISAKKQ